MKLIMNIIKQLLTKNNITITDLAKKINIDRSTLSRYVNNSNDLMKANHTVVQSLCDELNIVPSLISEDYIKKEISKEYSDLTTANELKFVGEEIRKDFTSLENTHIEGTQVERKVELEIKVFFKDKNDSCYSYIYWYKKYINGEKKTYIYLG